MLLESVKMIHNALNFERAGQWLAIVSWPLIGMESMNDARIAFPECTLWSDGTQQKPSHAYDNTQDNSSNCFQTSTAYV